MHTAAPAPLLLQLALTGEQQRQILERTGVVLAALPYASSAAALRIIFGGVSLRVPRGAFVPTSSTERLLESAVDVAKGWPAPIVVDVGTGCGAIALAAARALPTAHIFGTEVSAIALQAARANRARLGLHNVRFISGSLLTTLPARLHGRVAVIVANVPYVPPRLDAALAEAFPAGSAIGLGADGLELVRQLADAARQYLAPGGSLVLQLADFQWPVIGAELTALGYRDVQWTARSRGGPVAGSAVWAGAARRENERSPLHADRRVIHARFTTDPYSRVAAFTTHHRGTHVTPERAGDRPHQPDE